VAVYGIALWRGQSEDQARALTFTGLIVANLALILTNRSWSRGILATLRTPNKALWYVLGGAVVFLGLVLYVPALRQLFRFGVLHPVDLVICLAAGVVSVAWFEAYKAIKAKKDRTS
jgi:Ca2+-transporting ATPase